mmetsp:Transcript_66033/g.149034  ORF Transcript_66033/g.149034 Transcript_66033/m.149034 type:complete len:419 (-) Transcript_66033:508-1764(-)
MGSKQVRPRYLEQLRPRLYAAFQAAQAACLEACEVALERPRCCEAHQTRQIRPARALGRLGDPVKRFPRPGPEPPLARQPAGVDRQNLPSLRGAPGPPHLDVKLEPPRPKHGLVDELDAVRHAHHQNVPARFHAVDLGQKLVHHGVSDAGGVARERAPGPANRVQLVEYHDVERRPVAEFSPAFLGGREELPNPLLRGPHVPVQDLRPAAHLGLAGVRRPEGPRELPREESLTATGRPVEEHPANVGDAQRPRLGRREPPRSQDSTGDAADFLVETAHRAGHEVLKSSQLSARHSKSATSSFAKCSLGARESCRFGSGHLVPPTGERRLRARRKEVGRVAAHPLNPLRPSLGGHRRASRGSLRVFSRRGRGGEGDLGDGFGVIGVLEEVAGLGKQRHLQHHRAAPAAAAAREARGPHW